MRWWPWKKKEDAEAASPSKPPPLWRWVVSRTDWLAVSSCVPLSAGLILYCVPVSQAHGETKQLLRIADGGQSSLSWLATVYAITLGITLPLAIISILYSLLLVAASIVAHRHMHSEERSMDDAVQQRGRQLSRNRAQSPGLHSPPLSEQRPLPRHAATAAPLTAGAGWRAEGERAAASPSHSRSVPNGLGALGRSGSDGALSNGSASASVRGPSPPPSLSRGLSHGTSLPLALPPAAAAQQGEVLPAADLAQALTGDKRRAASLWERALGRALAPPGMQSVLSMLGGNESPGQLGNSVPLEGRTIDITQLKSPVHRRLPSMSMSMAAAERERERVAALAGGGAGLSGSSSGVGLASLAEEGSSVAPAAVAGAAAGAGARGGGGFMRLRWNKPTARMMSDDSALSEAEKGKPNGGGGSKAGAAAGLLAALAAVGGTMKRALKRLRRRGSGKGGPSSDGTASDAGGGGGPGTPPEHVRSGSQLEEQLKQEQAHRVFRRFKWGLLSLIAANTLTLVWLTILLVVTTGWLIAVEAVEGIAGDTGRLWGTVLGFASNVLGLTQQNNAAVSTFSQLFGMGFLQQVKLLTGGAYNYSSWAQLQEVNAEPPSLLGEAATVAYNVTVSSLGVQSLVAPQFNSTKVTNAIGVVLPCPSQCLNFRYFSFLESGSCVCDPATIRQVHSLSSNTVDDLSLALAGLGLMFVSVVILLLRFAVTWGQVRTRWVMRPALQVYAVHREETMLKRRWRNVGVAGRQPRPRPAGMAPTYSI